MKQYLPIFSFYLFLFCLTGCEKIVDFTGKRPPAKLTVTAIFGCNEYDKYLELSESYFIYSDEEPEVPYGAEVKVEINGKELNDVTYLDTYSGKITYQLNPLLKEGDVVKVTVESEAHGTVTGEETAPPPPVILDVEAEPFIRGEYGDSFIRALIRIKDDPSVSNYYRLLMLESYYDPDYPEEDNWYYIDYFIDQDLVMSSLSSQEIQDGDNNLMRIFPDDLFNGKEYTLNIYFRHYKPEGISMRYRVELQSLSESAYLYMRSLEMSANSDIFSEPVRIYSNIRGGYGIVGTYNSAVKVFW